MKYTELEYRKSAGGYSVDGKCGNHWYFVMKFSRKKDAIEFIKNYQF